MLADNYIAQLILGFSLAFALQKSIVGVLQIDKFTSYDVGVAIDYVLRKEAAEYPDLFRDDKIYVKKYDRIIYKRNYILSYNELDDYIKDVKKLSIPARHVIPRFKKKDLESLPDFKVKVLSELLNVPLKVDPNYGYSGYKITNEFSNALLKGIDSLNSKYVQTRAEISKKVESELWKHIVMRSILSLFIILFLVIQPWHLYVALVNIDNTKKLKISSYDLRGYPESKMMKIKSYFFISFFCFIGAILSYSTIDIGEAYQRSVIPGLSVLMFFWLVFDLNNYVYKKNRHLYFKNLCKRIFVDKDLWLIFDVLFFVWIVILVYALITLDNVSLEQITRLRINELIFVGCLLFINIIYFFSDMNYKEVLQLMPDRYVASLQKLSILSDEDEVDSEIIKKEIKNIKSPKIWLDVGSGSMQKVFTVNRDLKKEGILIDSIDCLEPIKIWRNHYNDRDIPANIKVHGQAWPNYLKYVSVGKKWSIITFIHVLYQSTINEYGYIHELSFVKNRLYFPGCVIIITEGQNSSLLSVKKEVYPLMNGTLVSETDIVKTTDYYGWPKPKKYSFNQKYFVSYHDLIDPDENDSAFPWFIFETSTSTCDDVNRSVLEIAGKLFVKKLKRLYDGRSYLSVQDVALIYYFE